MDKKETKQSKKKKGFFLDKNRKTIKRLKALANYLELSGFDPEEEKLFFQKHSSLIYSSLLDCFNGFQRGTKSKKAVKPPTQAESQLLFYLFEKLLDCCKELFQGKWQYRSCIGLFEFLTSLDQKQKTRKTGIDLLLKYLDILQKNNDNKIKSLIQSTFCFDTFAEDLKPFPIRFLYPPNHTQVYKVNEKDKTQNTNEERVDSFHRMLEFIQTKTENRLFWIQVLKNEFLSTLYPIICVKIGLLENKEIGFRMRCPQPLHLEIINFILFCVDDSEFSKIIYKDSEIIDIIFEIFSQTFQLPETYENLKMKIVEVVEKWLLEQPIELKYLLQHLVTSIISLSFLNICIVSQTSNRYHWVKLKKIFFKIKEWMPVMIQWKRSFLLFTLKIHHLLFDLPSPLIEEKDYEKFLHLNENLTVLEFDLDDRNHHNYEGVPKNKCIIPEKTDFELKLQYNPIKHDYSITKTNAIFFWSNFFNLFEKCNLIKDEKVHKYYISTYLEILNLIYKIQKQIPQGMNHRSLPILYLFSPIFFAGCQKKGKYYAGRNLSYASICILFSSSNERIPTNLLSQFYYLIIQALKMYDQHITHILYRYSSRIFGYDLKGSNHIINSFKSNLIKYFDPKSEYKLTNDITCYALTIISSLICYQDEFKNFGFYDYNSLISSRSKDIQLFNNIQKNGNNDLLIKVKPKDILSNNNKNQLTNINDDSKNDPNQKNKNQFKKNKDKNSNNQSTKDHDQEKRKLFLESIKIENSNFREIFSDILFSFLNKPITSRKVNSELNNFVEDFFFSITGENEKNEYIDNNNQNNIILNTTNVNKNGNSNNSNDNNNDNSNNNNCDNNNNICNDNNNNNDDSNIGNNNDLNIDNNNNSNFDRTRIINHNIEIKTFNLGIWVYTTICIIELNSKTPKIEIFNQAINLFVFHLCSLNSVISKVSSLAIICLANCSDLINSIDHTIIPNLITRLIQLLLVKLETLTNERNNLLLNENKNREKILKFKIPQFINNLLNCFFHLIMLNTQLFSNKEINSLIFTTLTKLIIFEKELNSLQFNPNYNYKNYNFDQTQLKKKKKRYKKRKQLDQEIGNDLNKINELTQLTEFNDDFNDIENNDFQFQNFENFSVLPIQQPTILTSITNIKTTLDVNTIHTNSNLDSNHKMILNSKSISNSYSNLNLNTPNSSNLPNSSNSSNSSILSTSSKPINIAKKSMNSTTSISPTTSPLRKSRSPSHRSAQTSPNILKMKNSPSKKINKSEELKKKQMKKHLCRGEIFLLYLLNYWNNLPLNEGPEIINSIIDELDDLPSELITEKEKIMRVAQLKTRYNLNPKKKTNKINCINPNLNNNDFDDFISNNLKIKKRIIPTKNEIPKKLTNNRNGSKILPMNRNQSKILSGNNNTTTIKNQNGNNEETKNLTIFEKKQQLLQRVNRNIRRNPSFNTVEKIQLKPLVIKNQFKPKKIMKTASLPEVIKKPQPTNNKHNHRKSTRFQFKTTFSTNKNKNNNNTSKNNSNNSNKKNKNNKNKNKGKNKNKNNSNNKNQSNAINNIKQNNNETKEVENTKTITFNQFSHTFYYNNTIITIYELPNKVKKKTIKIRIIFRDLTGKFVWDAQIPDTFTNTIPNYSTFNKKLNNKLVNYKPNSNDIHNNDNLTNKTNNRKYGQIPRYEQNENKNNTDKLEELLSYINEKNEKIEKEKNEKKQEIKNQNYKKIFQKILTKEFKQNAPIKDNKETQKKKSNNLFHFGRKKSNKKKNENNNVNDDDNVDDEQQKNLKLEEQKELENEHFQKRNQLKDKISKSISMYFTGLEKKNNNNKNETELKNKNINKSKNDNNNNDDDDGDDDDDKNKNKNKNNNNNKNKNNILNNIKYKNKIHFFHYSRLLLSQLGFIPISQQHLLKPIEKMEQLDLELKKLDQLEMRELLSVPILFIPKNYNSINQILTNKSESTKFKEFVSGLGWEINTELFLQQQQNNQFYNDKKKKLKHLGLPEKLPYFANYNIEILYQVITRIRNTPKFSDQLHKQKIINNSSIIIFWSQDDKQFDIKKLLKQVQINLQKRHEYICFGIYPLDNGLYRITSISKNGFQVMFPIIDGMILDKGTLSLLIRQAVLMNYYSKFDNFFETKHCFSKRKKLLNKIEKKFSKNLSFEKYMQNLFVGDNITKLNLKKYKNFFK
ncbi:rho gtpase-activating protein [Anaeramoeba flamelloides]|uniref:Rho gtpase-activating protein n=1 Tax=Anaeramoeba flamelloides TaxID=1746091 RepID=A0AAV7YTW5_9EUKA|nr:rho gtpase-activating protein [Anaeramoeba flamelloides]